MELMRQVAYETVLRACGFGSLTIFCVMVGLSFDPRLAFQAGGTLTTFMALVLIYKSREALTKDYRKTEMWLYIPKDFRPPEAYAQWASATVLRDTYLTFAMWTSVVAIAMWVMALFFSLAGVGSTLYSQAPYPSALGSGSAGAATQAAPAASGRATAVPAISYQLR
jgi:hypothetical protein